jgi:hypothetical protein
MDFYATLDQVVELLRSRGRVSYRALKEQFGLHDQRLDAIRVELLYAHAHDVQADEQGFVWTPRDSNPADAERRPAEVYRINGELLLRKEVPDPAAAERCFREALAMARDHDAKSWELRAAMSMARMWLADGRADDARALLSPVYAWFAEGFDTADLIDAKALLDQMSETRP